jgi:hypothetical protein
MLSNNEQQESQEARIYQERIRQAKLGFNLSIIFVGASAVFTLIGVVFLLAGHISQGAHATLAGLTSTAVGGHCVQLSREANDRLDRLAHELNDEDKIE